MRKLWIVGIGFFLLGGCKSEGEIVQELIDTNRSMAEERLLAFAKIGLAAKDQYVFSSDYGKIKKKGLKLDFTDGEGSNATWALEEDLVDLNKRAEPLVRFQSEDRDLVLTIADFLKKRGRSMSGDLRLSEYYVTKKFERLKRVRYLLVVRIKDYWPPGYNFDETFGPGRVGGDALLYRLVGLEFLGAIEFKATSSDMAVVGENDGAELLKKDLGSNMADAIREQLIKHIPGTRPQEVTGL